VTCSRHKGQFRGVTKRTGHFAKHLVSAARALPEQREDVKISLNLVLKFLSSLKFCKPFRIILET
jgi:hypothetical protein